MQNWNSAAEKSIHMFSFHTHGVIPGWNLWDVFFLCSSNLVSLIRHWFTISVIQQLGRRSSPLIVSGTTHTSTQYLSKHLAFAHSFFPVLLHITPPPPHFHLISLCLFLFPIFPTTTTTTAYPKRIKTKRHWQTETFLSMRSHSLMSVNQDENKKVKQMCPTLLWNVIACSQILRRKK